MIKTTGYHIGAGPKLKAAIKQAAEKRGKTVTQLFFAGLMKEAPELINDIVEDRT